MQDCQGGDSRSGNPALTRPRPVQSACGAAIKPSHPVRFSIGRVWLQPRSFYGALRALPQRWVTGRPPAGFTQGGSFLPIYHVSNMASQPKTASQSKRLGFERRFGASEEQDIEGSIQSFPDKLVLNAVQIGQNEYRGLGDSSTIERH